MRFASIAAASHLKAIIQSIALIGLKFILISHKSGIASGLIDQFPSLGITKT
jgi:hypothetical protein